MTISTERAFWILNSLRRRGSRLEFSATIQEQCEKCGAKVIHVSQRELSITIQLLTDDGQTSWDRVILLREASFDYLQLGEASFEPYEKFCWHSALRAEFPDGTTMYFAEPFDQSVGIPQHSMSPAR